MNYDPGYAPACSSLTPITFVLAPETPPDFRDRAVREHKICESQMYTITLSGRDLLEILTLLHRADKSRVEAQERRLRQGAEVGTRRKKLRALLLMAVDDVKLDTPVNLVRD
jgi:hypothetical protein